MGLAALVQQVPIIWISWSQILKIIILLKCTFIDIVSLHFIHLITYWLLDEVF